MKIVWRHNHVSNSLLTHRVKCFFYTQTPFMDQKEGDGIFINFSSLLRMKIEKAELSWMELRFETKS